MANEIIVPEVKEYQTQLQALESSVKGLIVKDQSSLDLCDDLLKTVAAGENAIIARKEEIVRPLMKGLSSIRELFKPLETGFADAKKTLKSKKLSYVLEQEEKESKEREKIAARVEKGTLRPETAVAKLEAVEKTSKSGVRTLTKIRVLNEAIIPRDYLVPNMTLITETVLRMGIDIPGVEKYDEKIIAVTR